MRVSRFLALPAIAAFLSLANVSSAADPPSGESLLQLSIDKSGGAEAYARAKNMTASGTVEMPAQNITGTIAIFEEGEKSYMAMDIAGIGKIEGGFDGETAWENSALQGPRILEGEEKVEAKRAARLSLLTDWRNDYKSARTVGSEDVDGKPAWKVEMTPKEGKPETFYFDRDSGLLVRIAAVRSTPLGDVATQSTMSDFRSVDGILTPFTQTETAMNQSIVTHLKSVSYNVPLPKDRFDLPASIKSLPPKNQ
jgi:hypothetical protein